MAGIADAIRDILTKLEGIPEVYFVRIWNNQVERLNEDENYSFQLPALFVEVVSPSNYLPIGVQFNEGEIVYRVHIVVEELDAGDGTMDQNLSVFLLRDKIISALSGFKPSGSGNMFMVSEEQDYEHTNLYHYLVEFKCSFIDSKGSPYDPAANKFITKNPPTDIQINTDVVQPITVSGYPFNSTTQPFRIKK